MSQSEKPDVPLMNLSTPEIEQIVLRVMEQLQTPEPASSRDIPHAPRPSSTRGEGVMFTESVITQELLETNSNGATRIRIGPKAIVTPSARDFLRIRGIECVRESSASARQNTARWQAIITKMTPAVAAMLEDTNNTSALWDRRLLAFVAEASQQAISAICRGEATGVVVFTDEPEHVACLVNRNDRVRATVVTNAQTVGELRQSFNPNVLAINPVNKSAFELRKVMQVFRGDTK